MKTTILAISIIISQITLSADPLIKLSKEFKLKPIPESKKELMAYTNRSNDPISEQKITLGKMLYFDPRLSKSNLISCNTCHNLALGGSDGIPSAIGHNGAINAKRLNSPTVYNSVFNTVQFWDGRSPHLEDQAMGPMQSESEMAAPRKLVEDRINSIPRYVALFKEAYGQDVVIDIEQIANAIGVFERTLVTPSRFDDFLNGQSDALSAKEKSGLQLFIDKGCAGCHKGIAIGGTMQPFQVAKQYKFISIGGFVGNKKGKVKAPTLRNVEETAPYFHNGAIWSLKDAIKEMGSVQLGISINDEEVGLIESFLKSLTGRKPVIEYPILPASTQDTPRPSFD